MKLICRAFGICADGTDEYIDNGVEYKGEWVEGYYVFSNKDSKHLIFARDDTPIDKEYEATWQKVWVVVESSIELIENNL